ncbi:amino acid/amide ABC transporter substrate-binding protein, HAAT family [Tistlia consotensis]|uniref:Amino acid/amide ABC transporter substrate-binding protein, HAAT family n=1 Tax=Tistlia consotensis USBA 355 TaxID=560819 RepID=A0A1Y6C0P7_9PROT|nr:ABC transporter substrate-binding protein [Tistlia consotensis]SMF30324.1 amino acid/amide ABC transporter substrate-binding protein, HAAT family [Tistlia consotensis USBA 355]SNR90185.1 amino acid/amide ABC transporter substrate-binding protein, HAAT family [Tistlia consotensis]
MKTLLRPLAAAVMSVALVGGLAAGASAQDNPKSYKIGAILAMSGKANWYGKVMSQAIEQAVDEINAAGGIDGVPLEAVIEDHKSGVAKEGVAAMNRLIDLHDVQAVLTSFSPPTLAIAPIADEKGIFLLNGGGVSSALIGASKYLFHNRSLASDLGRAAATRAHELGAKRMAQLAWKSDAGESVIKAVEPYWTGTLGGEIVATESMEVGATNIDTQMAKIRASKPDVLGLWLFSPDPGLAIKRAREFGMKMPIIGIEYNDQIAKLAGKYAAGYEYTSDYFTPAEGGWAKKFADGYEKRYGEQPEFYAANYYEGTYVIAELMRRAKAKGIPIKGDKLAELLRENPVFDSVYGGKMTFQDNGVAKKRVALFKVDDAGKGVFQHYIEVK